MASKTILIEVRVDEIDSMEPGYHYDPKMAYELVPTDYDLDGSIEFVCRKSELTRKLSRMDQSGRAQGNVVGSRAIYGEPEEEVGTLMRDAAHKVLSGFNVPALDAIVDSIEEAVMPNRIRQRRKPTEKEGE